MVRSGHKHFLVGSRKLIGDTVSLDGVGYAIWRSFHVIIAAGSGQQNTDLDACPGLWVWDTNDLSTALGGFHMRLVCLEL